ncbi:HD domain-containing protein [candidate division KSB1 bacterium]|nr:HD domain-containing protein [candidate division KSB1 bacterium]
MTTVTPEHSPLIAAGEYPLIDRLGAIADLEGVELYAVGGFVRDRLLGRPLKDIDFAVIGDAVGFSQSVARELRTSDPIVFAKFQTARVACHGVELDFVSARAETYDPASRKPDVVSAGLIADLTRRDFTVNALAVGLNRHGFGSVIDLFSGIADLKSKVLRTPLEPERTFSDDPLRMMRAVRFAAQLEFSVDPSALAAIRLMAPRLAIVSQERITDEFIKLLTASQPSIGLRLMYLTGLLDVVFPEVANLAGVDQVGTHHHKDVFDHTLLVVDNIASLTPDPELRLAALVHDIAKPRTKRFQPQVGWTFHGHEDVGSRMMRAIGRRMRLPEHTTARVTKLVGLHMRPINLTREEVTDSGIRRLIVDAGDDLSGLMTLCRADITSSKPNKVRRYLEQFDSLTARLSEVVEKDQLRAFQSPVRGDEIMAICNIPPGKLVGKIKDALEEAILDGRVPNEHDAVLAYLYEIKDQYSGSEPSS